MNRKLKLQYFLLDSINLSSSFFCFSRLRDSALRFLLVTTLISGLAGCYAFQSSTEYYGLNTTNENVVFLVDISGSMEGKQEGTAQDQLLGNLAVEAGKQVQGLVGGYAGKLLGQQVTSQSTKLGAAKRELIPAIRGLKETQKFAIVTFGGVIDPWHQNMIPATELSKNTEILKVNQLSSIGGTSMKAALEQAFVYRDVTTIFLMTDGMPTDATAKQIIQRVGEMNRGRAIKLNTIGLGSDQNSSFLEALAAQNSGKYIGLR